jgi:hypothetical protein
MIQVALEFTGESRRHLARLERETPRTFRAAHAAAATRAQNRLRKVMKMGGGHGGVPPFAPRHQMTHLLHPGRQAGGLLADKGMIVKFRRGDGQVIGWVDRVAQWASCYQSAARYEFETWQRADLHKRHRELNGYHIPSWYDRPARPVIKPFTDQLSKDFPGMVLEAFNKAVARRLKKGQVVS